MLKSEDPAIQHLDKKEDILDNFSRISNSLARRGSFRKALVAPTGVKQSQGLSVEHSEKGSVKSTVYKQYIESASKLGFA
jgi:hypothetical protein